MWHGRVAQICARGSMENNFLGANLRRQSGPECQMNYVYKYAPQEDSLLKCFKSYFEEKNLLLYTIFGWTLGSLAGRLHINRPECKPTARIHHHFS